MDNRRSCGTAITYSVIIPVCNEEASLPLLLSSLEETMERLGCGWELICVNDGSIDKSLDTLKSATSCRSHLAVVDLARHYGKSAALQAGFDQSSGTVLITMDADLQHDPQDIPALVSKLNEGFDVVCGWRHERKDPWLKVWSARIATAVRRMLFGERLHDIGCAFRAFTRESLQGVYLSGDLHRFFTLIMLQLGRRITEIKVNHLPRRFGKTKYTIRNRLFAGLRDMARIRVSGVQPLIQERPRYEIREIIRL